MVQKIEHFYREMCFVNIPSKNMCFDKSLYNYQNKIE